MFVIPLNLWQAEDHATVDNTEKTREVGVQVGLQRVTIPVTAQYKIEYALDCRLHANKSVACLLEK